MLSVDGLHVSYGSVAALRGVSIEVAAGEIVAVIGPNGAGKSTLLRTIAGLTAPVRGAIRFDSQSIGGRPAERLVAQGLSLVPEGRRIFGSLSVAENITLGATPRRDRQAVAADLERMLTLFPILRERFHQKAGKLSGGEQQMLAIARALMAAPRLLLLDEPSLGLAPLIVKKVYEVIAELRRTGMTVLVVEQAVHVALGAADRTYVMNTGAIVMQGASAELSGTPGFEDAYFGAAAAGQR
jgi:branched-chain amino acid transport system ATP-binding protein